MGRRLLHTEPNDQLAAANSSANVPAVLLGNTIADKLPVKLVHRIVAAIFLLLGIATLAGAGERFGF